MKAGSEVFRVQASSGACWGVLLLWSIQLLRSSAQRFLNFDDVNADALEPSFVLVIGLFSVLNTLFVVILQKEQKLTGIVPLLDEQAVDVVVPARITVLSMVDHHPSIGAGGTPHFSVFFYARAEALPSEDVPPLIVNETFQSPSCQTSFLQKLIIPRLPMLRE
jgi:hypothetical protein